MADLPMPDLRVPGYDDDDDDDDDDLLQSPVAPLSNPPPGHKLLTHPYDSLAELEGDLRDWAAQALFGIKRKSASNAVKDFGYTRVEFTCLRDKIRASEAIVGRASTSTMKMDCSWSAVAKALATTGRKWMLEIREGHEDHNHPPAEDREAIPTLRKFGPEHKAFIATFINRPGVSNRQISEAFEKRFPNIKFTKRQLADTRFRIQKASDDGYTPFQGTMKMLDDRKVPYRVLWSAVDPNKPEGLVWTTDFCKEQWALNPWVQMFDNTYKTNNKGLAFFQVISMGSLNKIFACAFGLINNERQEGFDWLMDQVNDLRQEIGARTPVVTITDYDIAMRNAIARVYPGAKPQLCIFHVNKNVVLHIKRKWDARAATAVAQQQAQQQPPTQANNDIDLDDDDERVVTRINRMAAQGEELGPLPETVEYSKHGVYDLWKYMIYVPTIDEFNTAWEKMQAFFADQTAILNYIKETYLPVVKEWAACYTSKNLNFGHRTTSPVESANRYLKTFLVKGNSTVKHAVAQSFEMVDAIEQSIREERQHQKNRTRHEFIGKDWLGDAPLAIALRALKIIKMEYRHMLAAVPSNTGQVHQPLAPCTGRLTTSMGIPCRHELLRRHQAKDLVLQKADFHPY